MTRPAPLNLPIGNGNSMKDLLFSDALGKRRRSSMLPFSVSWPHLLIFCSTPFQNKETIVTAPVRISQEMDLSVDSDALDNRLLNSSDTFIN